MRIYVAGGFLEKDMIAGFMRILRGAGHTITCDWTASEGAPAAGVTSDADLSTADALKFALADEEGVRSADLLWHVIAGYKGSRGAYVETGIARGMRKPFIVSGPDWRKSIFHHLASAKFEAHEAALAWLVSSKGLTPSSPYGA